MSFRQKLHRDVKTYGQYGITSTSTPWRQSLFVVSSVKYNSYVTLCYRWLGGVYIFGDIDIDIDIDQWPIPMIYPHLAKL